MTNWGGQGYIWLECHDGINCAQWCKGYMIPILNKHNFAVCISPYISLPISLSLYLSPYIFLPIYISLYISPYISLSLYISPHTGQCVRIRTWSLSFARQFCLWPWCNWQGVTVILFTFILIVWMINYWCKYVKYVNIRVSLNLARIPFYKY